MNIELIDKNKVLIDLCEEDMQHLSLSSSALIPDTEKDRYMLNALIEIAKIKTGMISCTISRTSIDAMPYDGGCFLLITIIPTNRLSGKRFKVVKKSLMRIFLFSDAEDMLSAIEKIHRLYGSPYHSTLILYQQKYVLLIGSASGMAKSILHILKEYALYTCSDNVKITHIREHGKILIGENAVEKTAAAFFTDKTTPIKKG